MNKLKTKNNLRENSVIISYYLVKYYGGGHDDYYSSVIFVTNNKSTAIKYCKKFNNYLKKWKAYYKQFEIKKFGINRLADDHIEKHYERWNYLKNITKCYYEEVKFR